MLDLDVTLKALMGDALNARHLYAVKMNHSMTECISTSTKVNGHASDAECLDVTPVKTVNRLLPAKINKWLHLNTSKSELCEESVRETFGHFGTVKRVILSAKPKESTGHARIGKVKTTFITRCTCCVGRLRTLQSLTCPAVSVCEFRGQTRSAQLF